MDREGRDVQMNMLVTLTLTNDFRLLAEGVTELGVHILYNAGDLSFQPQLMAVLEIQSWCVDHRQQYPIVLAFANLYTCGCDMFGPFRGSFQE